MFEAKENQKRAIEKALALDDQLGEAWASRGLMLQGKGKPEEVKAAFLKAIELSPNYSSAYNWYAVWIPGKESYEESLELFYKAALFDPLSSIAQANIGSVLEGLGRYDEALEQYYNLLQVDPDYAHIHMKIGNFHIKNGRLAEAALWFRKAMELDPGNPNRYTAMLYVYLSLNDFKAAASVSEAKQKRLGSGAWTTIAQEYNVKLAQGKLGELPGMLDIFPQKMQGEWWFYRWKAYAHLFAGNMQKAREYWLKWEPGWTDPDQWDRRLRHNCNFAGILMATGDEELSRDLLRQTIHYHEEVLPKLVEDGHRHHELGWCYLIEGSYEKALDFYEGRIEHGHIWDADPLGGSWWKNIQLPWWEPVRGHPRYIAMVKKVEEKVAEQRELLRQMDEAGTTVP